MGKVLDFRRRPDTLRIETQPTELTQAEAEACEIAVSIRKAFSDEEAEAIRRALEDDDYDE